MTDLRASTEHVDLLLQRWSSAELRGDTSELDELLAPDFIGVGPLGFVLSRADWLERHREHALTYARHAYEQVSLQRRPGCVVVVARLDADGAWQGHPVPAVLRTSLVLAPDEDGRWRVAFSQSSFMAGTPGSPPVPGRPAGGEPS